MVKSLAGLRRVVCGVSGGVDSAVSAHILKQKGNKITEIYI